MLSLGVGICKAGAAIGAGARDERDSSLVTESNLLLGVEPRLTSTFFSKVPRLDPARAASFDGFGFGASLRFSDDPPSKPH